MNQKSPAVYDCPPFTSMSLPAIITVKYTPAYFSSPESCQLLMTCSVYLSRTVGNVRLPCKICFIMRVNIEVKMMKVFERKFFWGGLVFSLFAPSSIPLFLNSHTNSHTNNRIDLLLPIGIMYSS